MLKTQLQKKKNRIGRIADFLRDSFGTVWFLGINVIFFLTWILYNSEVIPEVTAFDPYPYGMLTTAVSLEAIFLSIIVLMSQNRAEQINALREELDLEVNIRAEKEVKKILNMLDEIHTHLGLSKNNDLELLTMKKNLNITDMRNRLIRDRKAE